MHSLAARECRSRGRGSATSEAAYLPAVLPYLPTCLPPNFLKDFSMFISSTYRRSATASPPVSVIQKKQAESAADYGLRERRGGETLLGCCDTVPIIATGYSNRISWREMCVQPFKGANLEWDET